MGSIAKTCRLLSPKERSFLSHEADPSTYGEDATILASAQDAIEYQISVDSISQPPVVAGLPAKQQLYLLEIGQPFSLGFETCFMEGALVLGEYPRASVYICFVIAEGRTLGNWPVSYAWRGEAISIQHVSKEQCPPVEQVLPVYRSDWLEEAMNRQQ